LGRGAKSTADGLGDDGLDGASASASSGSTACDCEDQWRQIAGNRWVRAMLELAFQMPNY
jgi:hypothetical protein